MKATRTRLASDHNVIAHYFAATFIENHRKAVEDAQEADHNGRAFWGSARVDVKDVVATTLAASDPFAKELGPGVRYATIRK